MLPAFNKTIYIDMDGVVANFNSYASNVIGREIGWEGRDLTDKEWQILSEVPNLYYHLSLIPESKKLVSLARSLSERVMFLTAIPRRTTMPTAEQDKRNWLIKFFPGIPMKIGPHSVDKQKWCTPGDILIDDKLSNVTEWVEKEGIAVHHLGNWDKTLNNLIQATIISTPTLLN